MKKVLILTVSCLCLLPVWGQEIQNANGTYLFDKAELFIRHYQTKEVIEHKVLTDSASVDPSDFHQANIFMAMELRDGQLIECVLPDGKRYAIDEAGQFQPAGYNKDIDETLPEKEESANYLFNNKDPLPYVVDYEGNKLTLTFEKYNFGQSGINFTMEAELIVTMIKQNGDKK